MKLIKLVQLIFNIRFGYCEYVGYITSILRDVFIGSLLTSLTHHWVSFNEKQKTFQTIFDAVYHSQILLYKLLKLLASELHFYLA